MWRRAALALATGALAVPVGLAPAAAGPAYLAPVAKIRPVTGCLDLTPGMNGVKVKLVQRRLGIPGDAWETMDARTRAKVKRFQRTHHLRATGAVDRRTWKALGIRGDFCTLDRYQAKVELAVKATRTQRREQFIKHATAYVGEEYVWGGAGPKGYGIDCSGLVLQSLYSAGLDPRPISVLKHPLPEYRTSLELYRHPRLRHVSATKMRRGDLVFWKKRTTGRVNHVAIYLGDGKILEASSGADKVRVVSIRSPKPGQKRMPTVVRPF
jgi:cell wall-associated NlpC family hydrolase